jgi:20S proteasome alpha/beta subunit
MVLTKKKRIVLKPQKHIFAKCSDAESQQPDTSSDFLALEHTAHKRVQRSGVIAANLLLGGYDEGVGASLYWLDYLGTLHKMNICGTGYGSYFALSVFDRMWHPGLTQDEALEIMKKGVEEVRKRLVVAPERFNVKVVTAGGIKDLGYL